MIEIKKLSTKRWKEYRDLRLDALKTEPTAFSSSYSEEKSKPDNEWKNGMTNVLFVLSDDKPVGLIRYSIDGRTKMRHTANIGSVYVKKSYRGKGLGQKLLVDMLSLIQKNKNIVKIKLTATPEQTSAVKLYEKNGFVIVGRAQKHLKIGRKFFDELFMEKLL